MVLLSSSNYPISLSVENIRKRKVIFSHICIVIVCWKTKKFSVRKDVRGKECVLVWRCLKRSVKK